MSSIRRDPIIGIAAEGPSDFNQGKLRSGTLSSVLHDELTDSKCHACRRVELKGPDVSPRTALIVYSRAQLLSMRNEARSPSWSKQLSELRNASPDVWSDQ